MKFGLWFLQKLTGSSYETDSKPIIRHCKNCKWYEEEEILGIKYYWCGVKYVNIRNRRIYAMLCRYFKRVTGSSPKEEDA